MPDNKDLRGKRDRSRIDVNDPNEVRYVHHQFPWLSDDEIRDAIKTKGPDRDAVTAFLERKSKASRHGDRLESKEQ